MRSSIALSSGHGLMDSWAEEAGDREEDGIINAHFSERLPSLVDVRGAPSETWNRLQPRSCAGAEQPADVVSIAGLLTLQADSNANLLSSPPTSVSADQFALSEEVTLHGAQ